MICVNETNLHLEVQSAVLFKYLLLPGALELKTPSFTNCWFVLRDRHVVSNNQLDILTAVWPVGRLRVAKLRGAPQ